MNKKTQRSQNRPAFPKHRHRSAGFILSGFAVASAVSTGLFWIMYQLISIVQDDVKPTKPSRGIPFVIVKREIKPVKKPREKATPPPVFDQPLPPVSTKWAAPEGTSIFKFPKPADNILFGNKNNGTIGIGERDYMPLNELQPAYPPRALERGIQGTCVVVYTITKTGSVKDVRVDEQRCSSTLFHSSAQRAAYKFKYAPRVVDGETVETRNVTKLFRFSITE